MEFCLKRKNYVILAVATVLIATGFALTCGTASTPAAFCPEVFSFRRVVLGPNLSFFGYLLMIYGILAK